MGLCNSVAKFHLPGLFEFFELYKVFLPIYNNHREYFYEWVEISSIYGAPADCIWGGGRFGDGFHKPEDVLSSMSKYGISARLTFSNSLLNESHLSDKKCNLLCSIFEKYSNVKNGVIIHSDILLDYLRKRYPELYFVSSTTKVITDFDRFREELNRDELSYVVADFRFNNNYEQLDFLTQHEKDKTEFLCNECCSIFCKDRKQCYENVSRRILGDDCSEHICRSDVNKEGYKFSKAIKNPAFIGVDDIKDYYLPSGFSNFKIEGRGLGSAVVLEFILYYLIKPEYQLNVREEIYLDSMLDIF